jgi:hypothetical protein
LRCGFDAGFLAAASLPAIGISISFCLLAAFRGFFEGLEAFAGSAPPTLRSSAGHCCDGFGRCPDHWL